MKKYLTCLLLAFISCNKPELPIPAGTFTTDDTYTFSSSQVKAWHNQYGAFFVSLDNEPQHLVFRTDFIEPSIAAWCMAEDNSLYTFYNSMNNYSLIGHVTKYDGKHISLTFEGWFKSVKGVVTYIHNGSINNIEIK